MPELGEVLSRARQSRGLSIQDVADSTHISLEYIQAMEEDQLGVFPADVYARGFVRSYSSFLNIDPAPLLEAFQQIRHPELTEPAGRRRPVNAPVAAPREPSRAYTASGSLFTTDYAGLGRVHGRGSHWWLVAVLCILAAAAWFGFRLGVGHRSHSAPGTPAPHQAGASVHHVSLRPDRSVGQQSRAHGHTLSLRATGYVYISVSSDSGSAPSFHGMWIPGDHKTFVGEQHIKLYANRGNNLVASFDGKNIGRLSRYRRPITMIFPPGSAVTSATARPVVDNTTGSHGISLVKNTSRAHIAGSALVSAHAEGGSGVAEAPFGKPRSKASPRYSTPGAEMHGDGGQGSSLNPG